MKKVLVLTSGGDCSGMNAYIKALAKLCKKENVKLVASLEGFQGLVDGKIVDIDYDSLGEIQNLGGTIIKTSRSKDFVTKDGFEKAIQTLKNHNIDCTIIVGGNGSMRGANDLVNAGVNVLAIPGTIDNDLGYTQKTLGYDTACENATQAIIKIKQTMQACGRGTIVEVMGRNCADISIRSAILSNADMLITEKTNFEQILIKTKMIMDSGVECPLIVVQENLLSVSDLAKYLEENLKKEFRSSVIGYIQRGGEPTANDKLFAIELACATIKKIANGDYNWAIGERENKIIYESIAYAVMIEKTKEDSLFATYKQYCE